MPDDPADDDVALDDGVVQPHALWSGSISFGLLSLPVDLFPASRTPSISLRMVDDRHRPLTRRYFCPNHDRMLTRDEIVRGYEIEKDRYVVLSDEELESAAPEKSRAIDLRRFVKVSDIDPMYFKRSYFLTPGEEAASRAYRLLAETMERSGRVGIASFVMRGKEYLVALLAEQGILRAETLRFREELRSAEDVGLSASRRKPSADAVRRYLRAIAELAEDTVHREELHDSYTERLRALIDSKLERGVDVERAPEPEAEEGEAEIIDLMEVLKRRLQPQADEQAPAEEPVRAGNASRRRGADKRAGADDGTEAKGGKRRGRDDLESKSKSELYERAKALRVPGRSRMGRDELLRALREAGG